jgi:hypothetical protein
MFICSNLAFCIGPLLKYLPLESLIPEQEDLIPDEATAMWSPTPPVRDTPEPESLTPFIPAMPDHGDDSEDEFLFDTKHFESSSSTSSTNSFELVNI